jgi:hypothetical protein
VTGFHPPLSHREAPTPALQKAPQPRQLPASGEGHSLDATVRGHMEGIFSSGVDFSRVRIHHDAAADRAARAHGARAFTSGETITFADGRYAPGRPDGVRLLAHELAHVAQQQARIGPGRPLVATTDAAEAQAARVGEAARTGRRLPEAPVPALGPHLDKASPGELEAEAEMLRLLEASVAADDTAALKRRVDRLGELAAAMPFWQAEVLATRLAMPAPGDRLAAAFRHRLARETRQVLLGRLRARAATKEQLFSPTQDPRKDPGHIDNVLDEVRCWLVQADRYTVVFTGGTKVVPNADIDWTKTSKALPIVEIQRDEPTARAAVAEWQDVAIAMHYERAVAYYRGPGGAVLPTWFSPETAPRTYRLIMGVNSQVRQEAGAIADEFRKIRNGMIIGAAVGTVLKFAVRLLPGGGGIRGSGVSGRGKGPGDPLSDPIPDTPAAKPRGGSRTTTTPDVVSEPAPALTEPAPAPKLSVRERLTKFYERLSGKPPASNANDAMRQLRETLEEVEDQFSGVTKKNPPPPPKENDGRMYPPLDDFTTRHPDGSLSARTRAHRIDITPGGKITITSLRTGQVEFTKP